MGITEKKAPIGIIFGHNIKITPELIRGYFISIFLYF